MESEMTKERSSFTPQVNSPAQKMSSSPRRHRCFFMAQFTLRILAISLTLAAISMMVTSGQTVSVFGLDLQARYTYSSAFRCKVGADAVVSTFSALSLILVYASTRPKSNSNIYFIIFLHDMVMTVLTISGCAAATAIGYVGRYGQSQVGWMAVCDRVGKFCNKVILSIVLSDLAFVCFLVLTIMAANKLKSQATS